MCGIAGYLGNPKPDKLRKTLDFLRRRGPDGSSVWDDDQNIGLLHTRLAILDLRPESGQPMTSSCGNFIIIFNGEIYNYKELRLELKRSGIPLRTSGDTEVLLELFAKKGKSVLKRLSGQYAFAIWDRRARKLTLARDRTGEKPLYYSKSDGSLVFASQLLPLKQLLDRPPSLDLDSISQFLHYGFVPQPNTPYLEIKRLPAGTYLECDGGALIDDPKPYWSIASIDPITTADPVGTLSESLNHSIERTLQSDVPVGIALSGGLDSSAIAALAQKKSSGDQPTCYTIGYAGNHSFDERNDAKQFANHLGLTLKTKALEVGDFEEEFSRLVANTDELIGDPAGFSHFSVAKLAAEDGSKVLLSGIGSDELFWGYNWVANCINLNRSYQSYNATLKSVQPLLKATLGKQPLNKLHRFQSLNFLPFLIATLTSTSKFERSPESGIFYDAEIHFDDLQKRKSHVFSSEFLDATYNSPFLPFQTNTPDPKKAEDYVLHCLFKTWLEGNCLALGDRLTMASSIEGRTPFLESDFIETAVGVQKGLGYPQYYLRDKQLLKEVLISTVPEFVIKRKKRGFQPPFSDWLDSLLPHYLSKLTNGKLISLGILNENLTTPENYPHVLLYRLFYLEEWLIQNL